MKRFYIEAISLPSTDKTGTEWAQIGKFLDDENPDTELFLLDCETKENAKDVVDSIELSSLYQQNSDHFLKQVNQYLLASKNLLDVVYDAKFETPSSETLLSKEIIDMIDHTLSPFLVNESDDETTEEEIKDEKKESSSEDEQQKELVIDDSSFEDKSESKSETETDFSEFSDSEHDEPKKNKKRKLQKNYEATDILEGRNYRAFNHKEKQPTPITEGYCFPSLIYDKIGYVNSKNYFILWLPALSHHDKKIIYPYGLTVNEIEHLFQMIKTQARKLNIPWQNEVIALRENGIATLFIYQDYLTQIYGQPEIASFNKGLYDKNAPKIKSNIEFLEKYFKDLDLKKTAPTQPVPTKKTMPPFQRKNYSTEITPNPPKNTSQLSRPAQTSQPKPNFFQPRKPSPITPPIKTMDIDVALSQMEKKLFGKSFSNESFKISLETIDETLNRLENRLSPVIQRQPSLDDLERWLNEPDDDQNIPSKNMLR